MIFIPDLRGGGAERVTVNLCNELVSNFIIELVVMKASGEMFKMLNPSIKVHNCNINKLRYFFFKIPKIIRKSKPDYVLGQMWPLTSILIFAKYFFFLKGKFYLCEHVNVSESIKNETYLNYYLAAPIIFITHNLCNKLITVSMGVKYEFKNKFFIRDKKIKVIYNPVIDVLFRNYKTKKKNIWSNNKKIKLLSVGTLKKQKNFTYLIEALSIINYLDFELIIAGNGPEKENIISAINNYNLSSKIKLIGYKDVLNDYYYNTDIFILPSLWEGFGNVIVEALYYNKKVIATNCKYGPKEILGTNKFGYLAPLDDAKKFAELIKKVANYNSNKKTRIRALDFEVSKITKQYTNLFLGYEI